VTTRGAPELLRSVGLMADGPVTWGQPLRSRAAGIYLVELPSPPAIAPIELTRVGKWVERVPALRLDGARPTSKAVAARLAAFWLPGQPVLYVGATPSSIGGRVAALVRHVLGDRRPHAGAQWLKVLTVEGRLRIWWAETDAGEEYEDALLAAFAAGVSGAERASLFDASVVLPFANMATPTGERKAHGITGAVLPEVVETAVPTHVVEVPPGDALGTSREIRGTGTTRKSNARVPTRAARPTRRTTPVVARSEPEPTRLSADGLARLRAEHDTLTRTRRPEVIARIRAAKELGDLRENADYTAAREEQSFLEGRIQALEGILRDAVVVETPSGPTVGVGSRVEVEVDGERRRYTIVSPSEADPGAERISYASPVGKALMGGSPGSEVDVRTPTGDIRYRIVDVA
jgi:transcription elongation factor GreA